MSRANRPRPQTPRLIHRRGVFYVEKRDAGRRGRPGAAMLEIIRIRLKRLSNPSRAPHDANHERLLLRCNTRATVTKLRHIRLPSVQSKA